MSLSQQILEPVDAVPSPPEPPKSSYQVKQHIASIAARLWDKIHYPRDIVARWNMAVAKETKPEIVNDMDYPTLVHSVSTYNDNERAARATEFWNKHLHHGRKPKLLWTDGWGRRWVEYSDGSVSRAR